MASEPRFSISPLYLNATLGAAVGVDGLILPRFGFVLRGAFGLDFGGAEDAVLVELAVGESLGAVLERVRERVGSGVGDFESGGGVLLQGEADFLADALDGAFGD